MNKTIRAIRMSSQQLSGPLFDDSKDVVSYMGAIQAQDYPMSKWAVGIRLKSGSTIQSVEKALEMGEILRSHVMRPTWHLVSAEDIRWMLKLSERHIKASARTRDKALEITESLYAHTNRLIEKMLEGNRSLTRTEIALELAGAGVLADTSRMTHFMMRAEAEGIICSGVDKGNKSTYALLEERAAPAKELHREEALATLAGKYFRSHSPASLYDFAWWSGLSVVEARQATRLIEHLLITDHWGEHTLFIHQSCKEVYADEVLHLLPSYDEYIISYKDRSAVLDAPHIPKAYSAQGVFFPLVLHKGALVGRWNKTIRKKGLIVEPAFFDKHYIINEEIFNAAANRYKTFVSSHVS
ncbi:MAG: winged helix DNA-binding domain-containing protein [Tannerellaceae bacterium]|nr:winged helix DNA-binding domain-containing protein [Tannerellaceae bacterium]